MIMGGCHENSYYNPTGNRGNDGHSFCCQQCSGSQARHPLLGLPRVCRRSSGRTDDPRSHDDDQGFLRADDPAGGKSPLGKRHAAPHERSRCLLSSFRQAPPLCQWVVAGFLNLGAPAPHCRFLTIRLIPNPRFYSQTNGQPLLCFPQFHRKMTFCSDKISS